MALQKRLDHWQADLLMCALMALARLLSFRLGVQQLSLLSNRSARLWPRRRLSEERTAELIEICRRGAYRASRLVPGAACLHRAVASQVWLALCGIRSEVMIGFRKRARLEGHAWLEIETDGGRVLLFTSDEDGYSRAWGHQRCEHLSWRMTCGRNLR